MESSFILNQVLALFPEMRQNIDFNALNNLSPIALLHNLTFHIPLGGLNLVRKFCNSQESKVLSQIRQLKQVDILEEIQQISPKIKINSMSDQEIEHLFQDFKKVNGSNDKRCSPSSHSRFSSGLQLRNFMDEEDIFDKAWEFREVNPFQFN